MSLLSESLCGKMRDNSDRGKGKKADGAKICDRGLFDPENDRGHRTAASGKASSMRLHGGLSDSRRGISAFAVLTVECALAGE